MASQYSSIAKDFSSTRFKVWPVVKDFIDKINPDSINIELGCGNGKNMLYCKEKNIPIVGVDNCKEFVDICNERDLDVKLDNIQNITSYESSTYDNILCIAVLHHLKKDIDRLKILDQTIRILRTNGRAIFTVWALEQPETSKRKFTHGDNIVRWKKKDGSTHDRYYYIYKKGELEESLLKRDDITLEIKYDRGNHIIVITKK